MLSSMLLYIKKNLSIDVNQIMINSDNITSLLLLYIGHIIYIDFLINFLAFSIKNFETLRMFKLIN